MFMSSEVASFILFQRTAYIRLAKARCLKAALKYIPGATYNRLVKLEAFLRSRSIMDLYLEDLQGEFETFCEYLPDRCSRILDIGCGIGGIHLFTTKRCPSAQVILLDKSATDDSVYYSYNERGSFYNSLPLAERFLNQHGIENIVQVDADNIHIEGTVDVIISLISWGYHYPVGTYLDLASKLLSTDGAIIIDIRKGTDGLDALRSRFPNLCVIKEFDKHFRVCARR